MIALCGLTEFCGVTQSPHKRWLLSCFALFQCLLFINTSLLGATKSNLEKPLIPEDLYYQRKPIANDENSVFLWKRAAAVQVPPNNVVRNEIQYVWKAGAKRPTDEKLNQINEWLDQNKQSLDLVEESLSKPKAQWLTHHAQDVQPEIATLSYLIRARLVEADSWAENRQFAKAAQSLQSSLHLSQQAVEADSALLHYLIGGSARILVQNAILRYATRANTPENTLKDLLKSLPPLDSETNAYLNVLKVEFTMYSYPSIDARRLAEDWTAALKTNDVLLSIYPEELHRPFRILLDPLLVAMHPQPIDSVSEIENAIRSFRTFRTNAISPWSERSNTAEALKEKTKARLLKDVKPLMRLLENEPLPLSKQSANRVRNAYLQLENPVGRLFSCSSGALDGSDIKVFRFRTEREATRAILGIKIFEKQTKHLPGTLQEVVDAGILPSVPKDLFSNSSLLYSRERKLIWSVGEDGTNHGGQNKIGSRWNAEDAIWEIPETK